MGKGDGGREKRRAFRVLSRQLNGLAGVACASLSSGWVGGWEKLQAFRDLISPPNNLAVVACASLSSVYSSNVM